MNTIEQQKFELDFTNTKPILTPSGENIFHTGFILREVPSDTPDSPPLGVVPIQVFYDPQTGKIQKELLPVELQNEYSTFSTTNPSVPSPTQNSNSNNQSLTWEGPSEIQNTDTQNNDNFTW